MEMADELSMSLVRKGLATERIELYIGFDRESLTEDHGLYRYKDGRIYKGAVTADPYGRPHPKHANGNFKLDFPTSSTKLIIDAAVSIFEQKVDKGLLVRRVGVTACNVIPKQETERIRRERQEAPEQLSLFTDYDSLAAEKEAQEKKLEREKRLQEAMLKQSARSAGRKTVKTGAKGTVKSSEKAIKTAEKTSKAAIKTAEKTAKATQKAAQATAKAAQKAAEMARQAAIAAYKAAVAAAKAIEKGMMH